MGELARLLLVVVVVVQYRRWRLGPFPGRVDDRRLSLFGFSLLFPFSSLFLVFPFFLPSIISFRENNTAKIHTLVKGGCLLCE